ncbi:unnamed protein product [Ambrosiozyma monospora]|uniref:Unnamed protein product n=1 Tax=Ambrosiozyma monospora TaxID=43982 RepID=A0A9W7DP36_AMBMO|nr:unnamed protein product [Ambrosiozyma monospora]
MSKKLKLTFVQIPVPVKLIKLLLQELRFQVSSFENHEKVVLNDAMDVLNGTGMNGMNGLMAHSGSVFSNHSGHAHAGNVTGTPTGTGTGTGNGNGNGGDDEGWEDVDDLPVPNFDQLQTYILANANNNNNNNNNNIHNPANRVRAAAHSHNNSQSTSATSGSYSSSTGDSSSSSALNHNHNHNHNHNGEECNSDGGNDDDDDDESADEFGLGAGKRSNEGIKKMLVMFFKECCVGNAAGGVGGDEDFKQIYDCFLNDDEKKFLFDCVVFG